MKEEDITHRLDLIERRQVEMQELLGKLVAAQNDTPVVKAMKEHLTDLRKSFEILKNLTEKIAGME